MVNPEGEEAVRRYWEQEDLPFVGLADPRHKVASLYGQRFSVLRLGRVPSLVVVDRDGRLRYRHHGESMADIPDNAEVFDVLERLAQERASSAR